MRYPQILLCLTIPLLLSTMAMAGERPASAPPIDERLTGIESRLADHESRLNVLEGKSPTTAKSCPCPDGPCICDPDNCNCPDCPEHVGTRLDSRVRILHWSADWCGPCIGFEREAKPAGVWDRMLHYDFDSNAEAKSMLGVTQIPTVLLVKDERVIDRHVGQAGMLSKVQEWLKNPVAKAVPKQSIEPRRVVKTYTMPTRQTYFLPASGTYCRSCGPPRYMPSYPVRGPQRYTYGGCATCR